MIETLTPQHEEAILARIRRIPIFDVLGVEIRRFAPGLCEARVPKDDRYDGIFESFHGGMLMTVADTIACFALMTHTGPDVAMATTDMNIRFLAPCLTDVIAQARVIKYGKTLSPVHVDLYDTHDRLVAVAQVTYILLPHIPQGNRPPQNGKPTAG